MENERRLSLHSFPNAVKTMALISGERLNLYDNYPTSSTDELPWKMAVIKFYFV